MGIQVFEFRVQRERTPGTDGQHPDNALLCQTDNISILVVKLIDQTPVCIRGMLGDLLDEGAVIQLVNLFKLFLGRQTKPVPRELRGHFVILVPYYGLQVRRLF